MTFPHLSRAAFVILRKRHRPPAVAKRLAHRYREISHRKPPAPSPNFFRTPAPRWHFFPLNRISTNNVPYPTHGLDHYPSTEVRTPRQKAARQRPFEPSTR